MSEVSGTCGMCIAFCVHPMCSNYETLLADYTWKTSQVTSSMQVKYKSATWANVWGASQAQVEYSNTLWLGPSSGNSKLFNTSLYICYHSGGVSNSSRVIANIQGRIE